MRLVRGRPEIGRRTRNTADRWSANIRGLARFDRAKHLPAAPLNPQHGVVLTDQEDVELGDGWPIAAEIALFAIIAATELPAQEYAQA